MSVQTTSSYDALRAAIVSGEIAPDARLVEAEVSATFGMSRGAVRTAPRDMPNVALTSASTRRASGAMSPLTIAARSAS